MLHGGSQKHRADVLQNERPGEATQWSIALLRVNLGSGGEEAAVGAVGDWRHTDCGGMLPRAKLATAKLARAAAKTSPYGGQQINKLTCNRTTATTLENFITGRAGGFSPNSFSYTVGVLTSSVGVRVRRFCRFVSGGGLSGRLSSEVSSDMCMGEGSQIQGGGCRAGCRLRCCLICVWVRARKSRGAVGQAVV